MGKKDTGKHSFILLLTISLAIVVSAWSLGLIGKGEGGPKLRLPGSPDEVRAVADYEEPQKEDGIAAGKEDSSEEEAEEKTGSSTVTEPEREGATDGAEESGGNEGSGTDVESETEESQSEKVTETEEVETEEADTEEEETEEAETDEIPVMYEADPSYFDDALFIGDSRTVGLREYGNLGSAEVVADSGMSVYKIFNRKFRTVSGDKKLLETVLSEKKYGKIYLMLGINELGYDFNYTVSKYEELLRRIRELQPEALIFLEGNLHITSEKSKASTDFTNENIDRFNRAVEQMADDKTLFYLDVNELFDDGNGSLSKEYTTDDIHILAKYYEEWARWILKHAR